MKNKANEISFAVYNSFFVTKICAKLCEKITNLLKFFTNFSLKNCENFSQNVVSNSIHYYFASKSAAFLNVHIFLNYVLKCNTYLFTQTLKWHLETSPWPNTEKAVTDNGISWIQILLEVFLNSSHPDANLRNWNESDALPWSNSYWFRDFLHSNQLAERIPGRQEIYK